MKHGTVITWILFLIMVAAILLLAVIMFTDTRYNTESINACKDLGMEKKTINNFETCIEPDGTAHIVNFQCEGILWNAKCKAQFIKLQTFGVENVGGGLK
ncbi:hypothetical protein LCGC14_1849330 [marine sediment metagenome]|uniref:Uncharacterized protein n=1 Tax=marine sediment metagenome TaxID=412755 RepID=A0A0F9GAS9_9ZZZZ|nr:hypothetical protein [bacterium]